MDCNGCSYAIKNDTLYKQNHLRPQTKIFKDDLKTRENTKP
ncbi:hypothetical protein HAL07_11820 [Helicobacter ailurogastricus]|uniref:Uncharacterized protein n=1 Tax=Helicobacter ailurogastricus TaxID=1578720 RepID=A0A0K2Y316_9HELI|nr:hypothetical protein HAL011_14480 [Helicobacter ailurogastricus]CRF42632.1 hypothetical protein HAL013_08270 [Helicobacter ailurogastricus]CRF44874.1 hypothetical protein HAL09_14940 [Helicobacter ailurogastricus]CRF52717.1 hypothetical protein HAL07_11820 [Helicobacter ailurogastricus]